MTKFKCGQRIMSGTNSNDCGLILDIREGDVNGPVLVRWENSGEETWVGADCLNPELDVDRLREDRNERLRLESER